MGGGEGQGAWVLYTCTPLAPTYPLDTYGYVMFTSTISMR